jgi:hypothetical protein
MCRQRKGTLEQKLNCFALPNRPSNTKITKHDRNNIEQNMSNKTTETHRKTKKQKKQKQHQNTQFQPTAHQLPTYSTFKTQRTRSCTRPLSPAAARNGGRCGCRGSGNGKRWTDPATRFWTGPRGLQIVDLMVQVQYKAYVRPM